MKYRIVYRVDGKLKYLYYNYMMEVGPALSGILKATTDWRIEVLGTDNEYHPVGGEK